MSGFMAIMVGLIILFWLVIIGVIVFLVVYLVKYSNQQQDHEEDTPMEILKERYAKGEIDQEEFENRKKELEKEK